MRGEKERAERGRRGGGGGGRIIIIIIFNMNRRKPKNHAIQNNTRI